MKRKGNHCFLPLYFLERLTYEQCHISLHYRIANSKNITPKIGFNLKNCIIIDQNKIQIALQFCLNVIINLKITVYQSINSLKNNQVMLIHNLKLLFLQ